MNNDTESQELGQCGKRHLGVNPHGLEHGDLVQVETDSADWVTGMVSHFDSQGRPLVIFGVSTVIVDDIPADSIMVINRDQEGE